MPVAEPIPNHRSRLLDIKKRIPVLDDLVVKALDAIQKKYLPSRPRKSPTPNQSEKHANDRTKQETQLASASQGR